MIGALEDAIIAKLSSAFAGRLKEVDHKPAKFDADELLRILTMAPAIYVAFLGFQRSERPPGSVRATYGVYMVAANASGERARRRGDAATIGAYEMAVLTAATLERWVPEGAAGPMEVQSCENLYASVFEKNGITVYGLVCDVPMQIQDAWVCRRLMLAMPPARRLSRWIISSPSMPIKTFRPLVTSASPRPPRHPAPIAPMRWCASPFPQRKAPRCS